MGFIGTPTPRALEVWSVVRDARDAAIALVQSAARDGRVLRGADVDDAARQVIVARGFGDRFIHRTGHGIGVTTHEPPYMIEGERQPLVPGMCFSVEPGIYLPGRFGVRIEDIVTVTEDGVRRLNSTSRDMAIVS
jgi:Xaa-Pro aminopeptidase